MTSLSRRLVPVYSCLALLGAAGRGSAGSLDFVEAEVNADLAGVYDLALSPGGAQLYATGNNNDALLAFVRDGGTGALTFVQSLRDGQGGVDGLRRPRQQEAEECAAGEPDADRVGHVLGMLVARRPRRDRDVDTEDRVPEEDRALQEIDRVVMRLAP